MVWKKIDVLVDDPSHSPGTIACSATLLQTLYISQVQDKELKILRFVYSGKKEDE